MPYRDLTSFGGRPVTCYQPDQPAPSDVTGWKLDYDEFDDSDGESAAFVAYLDTFLDTVPTDRIDALVLGSWGYAAFNPAPIEQLVAAADRLPALRALFVGDIDAMSCEISWIKQGDLTPLLTAYPRLEALGARGGEDWALRPTRHDCLRELVLESGGLPGQIVRAVGDSDLPALETLELWLGVEGYGGDTRIEDLATILSGERLPALRHLRLRNAEHADLVAAAVAAAPIVDRLQTLDLSLGTLTDKGAEALLAGRPLTHLRSLDLHHHYLSDAMCERLRSALPGVVDVSEPEDAEELDDGGTVRYTAVDE